MRRLSDFAAWIRALAEPVLRETPLCAPSTPAQRVGFIDSFADERGHRRAVDRPLLAFMLGEKPPTTPALGASRPGARTSADLELWTALAENRAPAWAPSGHGPLVFRLDDPAIEIATETELSALHALDHLEKRGGEAWATRERTEEAAAWCVAHLQPDNATNHPWAAHIFARLGLADAEAALYAETLVSNCLALTGAPDRFSACVLLDAARSLDGAP